MTDPSNLSADFIRSPIEQIDIRTQGNSESFNVLWLHVWVIPPASALFAALIYFSLRAIL